MAVDKVTMLMGVAAAICTALSFVPQLVKIRRQGGRDLSDSMLGLYLLGVTLWLAYGVRIGAAEVIGANVVGGTLVIAAVVMKHSLRSIDGGGRTDACARTNTRRFELQGGDTGTREGTAARQRPSMGTHDRSSDGVSPGRLQPRGVG